MKLWNNDIYINKNIEKFTVGNDYILDKRIVEFDCIASIAHAKMLAKIGVISEEELEKLIDELNEIISMHKKGDFDIAITEEDCHTAIENHLSNKLGDLGRKIHFARSRNDQVITALRLYYKEEINKILLLIQKLSESLNKFSKNKCLIPGFTHTRKAMPSSISLWSKAFVESMNDNKIIISNVIDLINKSPHGTGAGYGIPFIIDREYVASLLDFKDIQSPLYVQNSRCKYDSLIMSSLSTIMYDLNKMSSDIILFSMSNFGYFIIPNEFTTGSSIMPQKKNPDALELIRGYYSKIISNEFEIKSLTSNLISGYHRDMQLCKEPLFKSFDIVKDCLEIMILIINNLKLDKQKANMNITGELYATEEVYKLVKKGIPFRYAHGIIRKKYN